MGVTQGVTDTTRDCSQEGLGGVRGRGEDGDCLMDGEFCAGNWNKDLNNIQF